MSLDTFDCKNPRCIGGYLYNGVGGMVFPTNQRCPDCYAPPKPRTLMLDNDGTIVFVPLPPVEDELGGTG